MSLCQRCFRSSPIYDCPTCKGYYCLPCDTYIHSFETKKNHIRRMIDLSKVMLNNVSQKKILPNDFPSDQNLNPNIINDTIPIYDSNIGKNTKNFFSPPNKYERGPYIDLDNQFLQSGISLENKIDELTSNIYNTKLNLNERIDSLYDHMKQSDEEQKNDIIDINSKN